MESARADQRRETGLRTRARLMDAALDLLAERGEGGVTLREITDTADGQCRGRQLPLRFAAIALRCGGRTCAGALPGRATGGSQRLDPGSTLEEAAAAFARPMISAMAVGGRELAVMRIVARAGMDPPEGWDRLSARFDRIRADVVRVLRANFPDVSDRELIFRTRCAAGLLNWLALAPVGDELRGKTRKQVERRLIPVLAGTFRGNNS